MHFVYKLDHLFQSTRVSNENSSITKAFHFSKLISTQDFFCIQHATFKATYWNLNTFWLHLVFFMPLMIYFQLYDLEIAKSYNLNSEKVETWHGIIFDPHNMCAKVERITAKTGCTSYKLDRLIQSTRVSHENSSVTKTFHFSKLISTQDFFHPKCNIQSHILKFQPFLTSFNIFHAFNDLFSA